MPEILTEESGHIYMQVSGLYGFHSVHSELISLVLTLDVVI